MPDDLSPPPGERDSHWRDQEADEQPVSAAAARLRQILVLIAVVAALGGATIGLFTWLAGVSTGPALVLSMIVLEHSEPLYPSHAIAMEDSDTILQHFPKVRNSKQSQNRRDFEYELGTLAKEGGPVVVHVSCQALTRGGEVYLLPDDARPDDPGTWLPLKDVLKIIEQCPAAKKLVLLDIAHPLSDPRLGVICDDVADGVRRTLDGSTFTMLVLSACGPGQTALSPHPSGASVFAHFLDEGLRGDADGWGAKGVVDRGITATELAAYVRAQTETWARQNRGAKQTPWLWGKGADFVLVDRSVQEPPKRKSDSAPKAEEKVEPKVEKDGKAEEKKAADKNEPPPKPAYPERLKAAWELRDKLASQDLNRLRPQALLQMDMYLLHAERRWDRAGPAELDTLLKEVKKLQDTLEAMSGRERWEKAPPSLTMATARQADTAALVKSLRLILNKVTPLADKVVAPKEKGDKDKEKDKEDDKTTASVAKELLKTLGEDKLPPPQKAAALLKAASQSDLNRAQALLVHDAVQLLLKGEAVTEYTETVWLRRAKRFDDYIHGDEKDPAVWRWPAVEAGQSLRTLLAAEGFIALVGQEPELLKWLLDRRFQQAEENRRKGEELLFWGKPSKWKDAAATLSRAANDYETLQAELEQVQAARLALKHAFVQMPGRVPWLTSQANQGTEVLESWREAYEEGRKLADLLEASPSPQVMREIKGSLLEPTLVELARRHSLAVDELIKGGKEQPPAALGDIQALRAGAGLSAEQRGKLWQLERDLGDELQEKSKLETKPRQVDLSAPTRADEDWARHTRACRVRAGLALDLLTLAGVPELIQARKNLDELERLKSQAPPEAWDALGVSLRKAWLQLAKAVDEGAADAATERLKHLLPALGGDGRITTLDVPDGGTAGPSTVTRWLRDRYRSEAKFLDEIPDPGHPVDSRYFKNVASRL